MRWKALLSARVFPSIAQLTENTNVVLAINSTDLRGANKHASRGNGVDRLTSPTRSFTLVTEASFTSTGIKGQLSSVVMKPSTTFSPNHRYARVNGRIDQIEKSVNELFNLSA